MGWRFNTLFYNSRRKNMQITRPKKTTLRVSEVAALVSFFAAVHFPEMSFVILAFAWLVLYFGLLLKNF